MKCQKELPSYDRCNHGFPFRLGAIMKEHKKKQQDIADYLGKSRQAIGFYLNGTNGPDWETIVKLAQYFDVSTDWLLGHSEYKNTRTAGLSVSDIGLSEDATRCLLGCKESNPKLIQAINILLEDEYARPYEHPEVPPSALRYLAMYLFFDETTIDGEYKFLPSNEISSPAATNLMISLPMGTLCSEALYNCMVDEIKQLRFHVHEDEAFGHIEQEV